MVAFCLVQQTSQLGVESQNTERNKSHFRTESKSAVIAIKFYSIRERVKGVLEYRSFGTASTIYGNEFMGFVK